MNHSVSSTIIITSTAEHEIERNLQFIIKRSLSSSSDRKLNTYQESRHKRFRVHAFNRIRSHRRYLTSRTINSSLRQIGSIYRRCDGILSKGRRRLFIRGTIRTNLVISGSISTQAFNTISVPRSNLCHTLSITGGDLPSGYQLKTHSRQTKLVKQARQVRILRNLRKNSRHGKRSRPSSVAWDQSYTNVSAVLQTELRKVALLLHSGKLSRTTNTVETRTPIPSVGTSSRATITTVNHSGEW